MKERAYILVMILAAFIMLTLPFVPHHHHEGMWCNIVESCSLDHQKNDRHTNHQDDKSSCVEETQYIVTKSELSKSQLQLSDLNFVTLFNIVSRYLLENSYLQKEYNYEDFTPLLYTSEISDSSGLRAPPMA